MANRVFSQVFGVAGAILEREGKVLLVKEGKGVALNLWNQPAGWIEVGEDPIQAVIKEVKEETGYDFKPSGIIGIYSTVFSYKAALHGGQIPHPIKFIFRGEIIGGKEMEPNEEILELRWFTQEEIMAMSRDVLRDPDIKEEVKDYFAGRNFSLDIIKHAVLK